MSKDNRAKKSYYDRFFWTIPVYILLVIIIGISGAGFWFTVIAIILGIIIICIIFNRRDEKIKAQIKRRIEEGDLNAQIELGDFLMSCGSEKDMEEARSWFEKAVVKCLDGSQSKLDECRKKIKEKAEEEARKKYKAEQKAVIEAARPVCKQCGGKYDYDNKYAFPPFCCSMCRAQYQAENV